MSKGTTKINFPVSTMPEQDTTPRSPLGQIAMQAEDIQGRGRKSYRLAVSEKRPNPPSNCLSSQMGIILLPSRHKYHETIRLTYKIVQDMTITRLEEQHRRRSSSCCGNDDFAPDTKFHDQLLQIHQLVRLCHEPFHARFRRSVNRFICDIGADGQYNGRGQMAAI